MKNISEMAWEEAVNTALSDLGELGYEEILEKLQKGEIPEGVSAWEPFEYYCAERLYDVISGFQAQFERFGKEVAR